MARLETLSFILYLAAIFFAVARACSVPPAGCSIANCNSLTKIPGQSDHRMGFWEGIWNKLLNKTAVVNQPGGPFVNYEIFTEIGYDGQFLPVDTSAVTTLSACCHKCRTTEGCWNYQWFASKTPLSKTVATIKGYVPGKQCYLNFGGKILIDDPVHGTPLVPTHSLQVPMKGKVDYSYVGGRCNGNPNVVNDPHFTGGQGTRFDFNGAIDKAFCLTTDHNLHINVVLGGYQDTRSSVGASSIDGKTALRTWIKQIGIKWRTPDNEVHSALFVARGGKEQMRNDSPFLQQLVVDGADVAVPSLIGASATAPGDLSLSLAKIATKGALEVEHYNLKIADVAEIGLQMRAAHPMLQTESDAQVHFNVHFERLESTPDVHGVLGQTFRKTADRITRAQQFSILTRLMRAPVVADGPMGEGFLDGKVEDYVSTDVLATDCGFAAFPEFHFN